MSKLPKGWAEANLGELSAFVMGQAPPGSASNFDGVGTPFVKAGEFGEVRPIIRQWTTMPLKMAEEGDVLICVVGATSGKINLGANCAIGRSVAAIRPSDAIYQFYLHSFMKTQIDDMRRGSTGTAQGVISSVMLAKVAVPLAPLPEQKRIVAKVDGLTARTARARTDLAHIPTLIARYKQRLLALAFSGDLTAGWRDKQNDQVPVLGREKEDIQSRRATGKGDNFTPPFEIPSSWNWLKLPELGDLDRGKSRHRPRNDPRLFGGNYPFVQTGDVRAAERFLTTYSTTYSDFGLEQSRLWPIGTVCITIAANIAETAILGIEACFPDSVVGFSPDDTRISSDFVEFFLRTMRDELEAFAPATAQKNINLGVLNTVRVPVPPLIEQLEITRCIESAFNWLDRVADDHAAASNLLPKLDAAILAKAFRGELVPQDPNDEPASMLLERIQAERAAAPKKTRDRRSVAVSEVVEIQPPPVQVNVSVGPVTIRETRGGQAMTKSRQDDDVMSQPYLAGLIKKGSAGTAQDLFKASDLPVADFYKQLAWEIEHKHIRDDDEKLEAL